MLAKLKAFGLVFVDLTVAIEHIARHEGAVTLREIMLGPRSLKQWQRIGLSHLGVEIVAIRIGHTPKDELGKELAPMVEPRVILPHTIGNAHHAHLLIDLLLHGGPFGCGAVTLGNTHEGTEDRIHATPAEQPQRAGVVIHDGIGNDARTGRFLAHIALEGNVSHKRTLNHLGRRGKRRLVGGDGIGLQLRPSLGVLIAPKTFDPTLGKGPILTKLAGQRIGLVRHNIPGIGARTLGPPMRIHLAQRMDAIAKKVILRSRIHHSLNIKQVKIQSQMNKRVHIIDFHIGSNNHPCQILRHKQSSNQNHFSQLRARQDGTHAPIATDPACCRKRPTRANDNGNAAGTGC